MLFCSNRKEKNIESHLNMQHFSYRNICLKVRYIRDFIDNIGFSSTERVVCKLSTKSTQYNEGNVLYGGISIN